MSVGEAFAGTGAVLLIPAVICWIIFGVTCDFPERLNNWRFEFKWWALLLAIVFTVAVIASWIAGIWVEAQS